MRTDNMPHSSDGARACPRGAGTRGAATSPLSFVLRLTALCGIHCRAQASLTAEGDGGETTRLLLNLNTTYWASFSFSVNGNNI